MCNKKIKHFFTTNSFVHPSSIQKLPRHIYPGIGCIPFTRKLRGLGTFFESVEALIHIYNIHNSSKIHLVEVSRFNSERTTIKFIPTNDWSHVNTFFILIKINRERPKSAHSPSLKMSGEGGIWRFGNIWFPGKITGRKKSFSSFFIKAPQISASWPCSDLTMPNKLAPFSSGFQKAGIQKCGYHIISQKLWSYSTEKTKLRSIS